MTGYWLLRCIVAALIFLPFIVHAHDIYTDWKMPDQRTNEGKRTASCCNNVDCAPYPSKWISGHWEVLWRGKWVRVPEHKVETNYDDAWTAGDHQGHACMSSVGTVLCFRPGEWLQ